MAARLLATLAMMIAGAAQAVIPANQRQVLLDLYNNTGGANWTDSTGWLGAVGTECSWFGITCNGGETAVTEIDLVGNNLAGTLPAIGALSSLQYFNVGENLLTGPLPAISGLSSLQVFHAYNNALTGSIPALAGMSSLQRFHVGNNQLSGSLPSLAGLTSLIDFFAHTNQLTGSIPSLTGLSSLAGIGVYNNQLNGSIPALGGLTSLDYFDVGGNALTGSIPPLTGLTSLRYFAVTGNQLTGSIPSLAGLTALQELYVNDNALTGSIPALAGSTALLGVNVGDNQLTGSIPPLTGLNALQAFIAQQNQLSGGIPALTGLTNLQLIALGGNSLTGSIPSLAGLASLEHFDAVTNMLGGSIPSLAGLSALRNFYVSQNQLSGAIPSLAGLTALEDFSVGENQLTGSIPSLAGLTSLKFFFVYSNQLTGGIPSLAGAPALEVIYVGDNPLGGSLPSFAGLTTLREFSASGAALTGTIPSLAGLSSIQNFYVSDNALTGSIPSLAGLSTLEKVNFGNNQLSGSIPSLSGLGALIEFFAYTNQLTGPIPTLSGLGSLEIFSVSGNQLSGSIPSLAGLDGLIGLQLDDNQLTGTIPSLADLTSLQQFQVAYNQLSGALPPPPNPSSLLGGLSSLCPNLVTPVDNVGWDFATGIGPWWAPCTDTFAYEAAPPLPPGPGSALAGSAVGAAPGLVAVGAPGSMVDGVSSGQVFVYTGTSLVPQGASPAQSGFTPKALEGSASANLRLPVPVIGDKFGQSGVAVSPDGNTIAVGAPGMDADTGGVAIFRKPVAGWTGTIVASEVLVPDGAGPGDSVGSAVAITNAGTILVGAPGTTVDAATGAGAVYVLRKNDATYAISAPRYSALPQANAAFGSAVSGEGSELAVGAPGHDVAGRFDQGRVELFREAAGVYAPLQVVEDSGGALGDKFGTAIAVRNGTMLVAAPGADRTNAPDAGEAVFYDQADTGAMGVAATLSQSVPQPGAEFGRSLELAGDFAIIGAPLADVNGNIDQGVAEVYVAPLGGIFSPASKPTGTLFNPDGAPGDAYGAAVAMSGDLAAIGEPFRFATAPGPVVPGPSAKGEAPPSATGEAIAYTDGLVFRDGLETAREGVVACFSPNLAIPDNSGGGANSEVSLNATGNVRNLDVGVRIAHTQVGDLRLTLTHVGSGRTVPLYIPVGNCATDNIDAVFDDQGLDGYAKEQCAASAPGVRGRALPNDWLTIVQGVSRAGPWRLNVADAAAGNTGVLQAWCLEAR